VDLAERQVLMVQGLVVGAVQLGEQIAVLVAAVRVPAPARC